MHLNVAVIAVGAAALIIWIAIVGHWCLSAHRSWREAAAWTEFSRAHRDVDRELDGIWEPP